MTYHSYIQFFTEFLAERGTIVSEDELLIFPLTQSSKLDSFELLSMLVAIETEFGVAVPAETLLQPEQATLGGLIEYLVNTSNS
jgi:acyl carrier protein